MKEYYKKRVEQEFKENQISKWKNLSRKYLYDPKKAYELLYDVEKKLHKKYPEDPISKLKNNIVLFYNLFSDWVTGKYKEISPSSILLVVVGLLYFVIPTDIIPDWVVGIGFIDDATVLSIVIKNIGKEIKVYRKWMDKKEDEKLNKQR